IQSSITVSLVCQPTAPTHYHFSSTTTAPTDTYTLSLHDALPISKDAWPQSNSDCPATKRSKKGTSKSFPDTRRSPGVTRAVSVRGSTGSANTMISQTAPVSIPKRTSAVAPKPETVLNTDQLVKIYGGRAVV